MLHEKLEPASPVTAEWLLFELGLMHLSDGITGYQLNNILAVHNKTELACLSCGCQSTPEYQHCLYFRGNTQHPMLRVQCLSFVAQTLHLKTPDDAMAYLLRFLLKNAVMLSNGILSIRSYKSTCVASLTIRSSFG